MPRIKVKRLSLMEHIEQKRVKSFANREDLYYNKQFKMYMRRDLDDRFIEIDKSGDVIGGKGDDILSTGSNVYQTIQSKMNVSTTDIVDLDDIVEGINPNKLILDPNDVNKILDSLESENNNNDDNVSDGAYEDDDEDHFIETEFRL